VYLRAYALLERSDVRDNADELAILLQSGKSLQSCFKRIFVRKSESTRT
jgi:hypothetical protein